MKHLINFTDLTENYSLYLESEDLELDNDYSSEEDELDNEDNEVSEEEDDELHENKKSAATKAYQRMFGDKEK